MQIPTEQIVLAGSGGAFLYWLVVQMIRIFRGEKAATQGDAAQQQIVQSLRTELKRKDDLLIDKENTIKRLVKEKAEQLSQLSEIPRLTKEIRELEGQVKALASLLNHLITAGSSLTPEQQIIMIRLLSGINPNPSKGDDNG